MIVGRSKTMLMEWACRWLLCLVFLYAGIPKLADIDGFAEVVAAYGLLPDSFVLPAAAALAVLEIVAGVGLLLRKRTALFLAIGLMTLFIAVLVWGIWLGLDIDCGCFGKEEVGYRAFSGLRSALFRDVILLLPLAFLYLQPRLEKIEEEE